MTSSPGARTAWHTHPAGQLIYVIAGLGWAQKTREPKRVVEAGDTIWFEPGELHWHGASDTKAMTYVAIAEAIDGSATDWGEHVTDKDYLS
ncbi:cupin domain-containing protein [Breoghania sp.]|uniref:cupin domain-containing protein n=1 Tax=Breoghania sp. TaxID=2065378 RepID=UPI0032049791